MEKRTFQPPDVRCGPDIEFCTPSWQRAKKYVSWRHWLSTKTLTRKIHKKELRTLRYKLFEMGHFAGAVILEIGLRHGSQSVVAIKSAEQTNSNVQYFAVSNDKAALSGLGRKLKRKRVADRAVLFNGSLSEFRNFLPVTPTMVVINESDNVDSLLTHLALFLANGTPVLVQNWFMNRADLQPMPTDKSFEFCGRYGESVLLRCTSHGAEHAGGLNEDEFELTRQRFCIDSDGQLIQNRGFYTSPQTRRRRSDKKWPFNSNTVPCPATLPDGTQWPKISIVTPSYNQGNYIEETIASVLNQNYPNLEYIVVDGQSTDRSSQILEQYKDQIDYLICEPDDGQSDAINKGMHYATGEILTWLNSDDMLTPGALFAMAMAFWKSKADMVVGAVQFVEDGQVTGEHLASCDDGVLQLKELLDLDGSWLKGRFFYQPEVMFTADLWRRSGGCVDKDLFYSMDYDLWVRFAIAGANISVVGRPMAMYRVHDQQKTHGDYEPELRRVNRRYQEKFGFVKDVDRETTSQKYQVTFVNDIGPRYGAGIAHARLRDTLAAAGHETKFVFAKENDEAEPKSEFQLFDDIDMTEPDLVMVGNLHNAGLGMGLVQQIADRWPTCFVMHDLWMATGRCLYHGDCEKFKSGCDAGCPTSTEYPAVNAEQIQEAFSSKLNVISSPRKMLLAANSNWTRQVAEQSAITNKGVLTTLKYGFPTHVFKPRDKALCRELLGLPQDAFIVLFVSVNVGEQRKGLRHLFEALSRSQLENLVPVCIGHAIDTGEMYPGTISMGFVDDPYRSALIYSAADVFVGPSLEEAFGQVFVEAAACGTPSVGYPVGGVREAISHGVTGLIAREVAPNALADEITKLYFDPELRKQLSFWGRLEVENQWSLRSAYHRFNNMLSQFVDYLGFAPPTKIEFDPSRTAGVVESRGRQLGILEKNETSLSMGTGFAGEERLQLADGSVCRARWAVGNQAFINVCVDGAEPLSVWAECMNPVAGQRITVVCNEKVVGEVDLIAKPDFLDAEKVCLVDRLETGEYQIRLEFSGTIGEQDGSRELAVLFANLRLESCGNNAAVSQGKFNSIAA